MTLTDNQHKALAQLVKAAKMITRRDVAALDLECRITHKRAPFTLITGDTLKRSMEALVLCGFAVERVNSYQLTEAGLKVYSAGPWNPGTRRGGS